MMTKNTKILDINYFEWEETSNEKRYEHIRQYFKKVHGLSILLMLNVSYISAPLTIAQFLLVEKH